jgi:hypothetical protein
MRAHTINLTVMVRLAMVRARVDNEGGARHGRRCHGEESDTRREKMCDGRRREEEKNRRNWTVIGGSGR